MSLHFGLVLWDVFGESKNYNVLSGHKSAVLELQWHADNALLSCSADKSVALWDANQGNRLRKFTEHTAIVNSCAICTGDVNLCASGSDDCTAIIWDSRVRTSVATLYHDYQLCAVALSHDGQHLYTGGLDNLIRRFDLRMGDDIPDLVLTGHADSVTGLSLSADSTLLLSNSMDSTMRVYDVRAFSGGSVESRYRSVLSGVHHGAEKLLLRCAWSADMEYISAGSADRMVHLWEATRYTEQCAWNTHKASVNEVIFHPSQPILASCSSDKTIVLGEFTPQ
jgi:Prp8 binding protein